MLKRLNQLYAATAKELLVCYRDPDVFIYSVMLPALIYPMLLFFGSEFMLWRSGATANFKVKVAMVQPETKLIEECRRRLKAEPFAVEVQDLDPMKLLQSGQVDAVIGSNANDELQVSLKGASASAEDAKEKLQTFFEKWQREKLFQRLSELQKDKKYLQVFSVDAKDISPSIASSKVPKEKGAPLGAIKMVLCTILCLACSSIAYGAMAPVVCLFTEEREKSTLPTTLLLPASRSIIIGSKLIATTIVSLSSGLANLINLILVGLVLLAQTKMLAGIDFFVVLSETLPPFNSMVLLSLLIGLAVTVASVLATAAASARDYSQAYNLLTVPLLWASILPLMGALPVVHNLDFAAWLPIANLAYQMTDVLNRDVRTDNFVIATIENVALIILSIIAVKHIITSEKILSGPAS